MNSSVCYSDAFSSTKWKSLFLPQTEMGRTSPQFQDNFCVCSFLPESTISNSCPEWMRRRSGMCRSCRSVVALHSTCPFEAHLLSVPKSTCTPLACRVCCIKYNVPPALLLVCHPLPPSPLPSPHLHLLRLLLCTPTCILPYLVLPLSPQEAREEEGSSGGGAERVNCLRWWLPWLRSVLRPCGLHWVQLEVWSWEGEQSSWLSWNNTKDRMKQ